MPSGSNYTNFIIINIAFICLFSAIYYLTMISSIKANWAENRCNPLYMMFADDAEENFQYCVMNMQSNYMGYLLQPLTFLTNNLTDLGGSFNANLVDVRSVIGDVRTNVTGSVIQVFSIFLNIIIEFQRILIAIKDMIGKIVGVVSVMMFVLSGSQLTIESLWNGPAGQTVRALGSACFHKHTTLLLKNGNYINIENISIGDVLKNGAVVEGVLQLKNKYDENLYTFENFGENYETIYVTGEHFVYDDYDKIFIPVKNHPLSIKSDYNDKIYYNLITSNNTIHIGNLVFYDYNDDILRSS